MKEKTCENCIHYFQHYTKRNGNYRPVCCGHCINKKLNGHFRKTIKICEYYEEKDLQKEKDAQLRTATEWLEFIGNKLNEIRQILKE